MLKRWLSASKTGKKKSEDSDGASRSNSNEVAADERLRPIVSLGTLSRSEASLNELGMMDGYSLEQSSPQRPAHFIDDDNINPTDQVSDSMTNFKFLNPKVAVGMPFGDGSNKIFGYENFGNTCYCNSILQCLFNLTEFRNSILQFPERAPDELHLRKTEMPGRKLRVFDGSFAYEGKGTTSQANANVECSTDKAGKSRLNSNDSGGNNAVHNMKPTCGTNNNDSNAINANSITNNTDIKSPSTSRKLISGLFKSSNKSSTDIAANPIVAERSMSTPVPLRMKKSVSPVIIGRDSPLDLTKLEVTKTNTSNRYKRVIVGRTLSEDLSASSANADGSWDADNDPALAKMDSDRETTNEQRKRNALLNGPLLNVDHCINGEDISNLYHGLKDIFESITENNALTGVVSPVNFIDILKRENILFNTMMHQDAHEFLNFLFNDLSDFTDNYNRKLADTRDVPNQLRSNFINDLFQGTQTSKVRCLTCDSVTSHDERFLDFPIELEDSKDAATDIQEQLREFCQTELLHGANKFYCNECCGLQEAQRVVGLKKLPRILALHLKRFKYSEAQNTNIKLFNKITYPLFLEVASKFDPSVSKKYELTGVVLHMGGGPQHGHYVSVCKTDNFGWLFFDDETVETLDEPQVLNFTGDTTTSTTAYVLFYKETDEGDDEFGKTVTHSSGVAPEAQFNVDALLKEDSYSRLRAARMSNEAVDDGEAEDTFEENNDDTVILATTSGRSVSSGKIGRKSRLFSFMSRN
ncbi:uncharacterized protein KNAG_0B02370 [Huiozyma naganishii CBS 8797]|uniref:Ubiquitin carboxyl-terminal hydrolase n=1 Tax=Huiozyma naganishii (strain ATCC MYA-139 / BCRC 22969 / CBS 8797 / KCTC 17520 / NBRC 10181 / NCYC 3082 / Yp74L-3) TaxID=1071383 RepID=J7S3E8_HUIN7|nr:hypothetical protein KNAG_0B02370 [Kazachstania naganishii CBS 8797]CCK68679.1 hypothetical protein KNAG_0B02370 [Kazachstania naganishii CBS 8797]